jgi:hypothetical protein
MRYFTRLIEPREQKYGPPEATATLFPLANPAAFLYLPSTEMVP